MFEMYLAFLLVVLCAASAQATCPVVKTADNFNVTALASGTWTDQARYPNHYETAEECLTLKYSMDGDTVRLDSIDVAEDQHNFLAATGKVEPDGTISLTVTTGYPRSTVDIAVTVMFVDYDKYVVFYDCVHLGGSETTESVWISSRAPELDAASKEEIYKFIESSDVIDMNKLIWIHNSDERCNQQ